VSNVTQVGTTALHPPASWVLEYTTWARDRLGLQIWDIDVLVVEHPNLESASADGNNEFTTRYLQSTIRLREEKVAAESVSAKVLILHELIHLLFAPLQMMADRFLLFAGEGVREQLGVLWTDTQEPQVVRLSYALYEILEPAWQQYKREQRRAERAERQAGTPAAACR
jgi:hypothetical protein